MVPAQQVQAMRKFILSESLHHSGGPAPPDVLPPAQNRLCDDLRTVRTQAIRERYHQLLDRLKPGMDSISPDQHLSGLRAPVYILHGADDNSIPPEESLWRLQEAPHGTKIHVLITAWMTHAVFWGRASILEKIKVGNFVCEVLQAAFRPVPL